MNMLVASAQVDFSLRAIPIPTETRLAPFDWLVFDEPNALLGVNLGPSLDNDRDDDGVLDAGDLCPLVARPQARQTRILI